jgi:plasmid stability protein
MENAEKRIERTMKVSFPPELKHWLKIRAAQNLRSMNAEVISAVMREKQRVEAQDAAEASAKN